MSANIKADEPLKAAIHGLVLGVILIPLLYNLHIRKWSNVSVYGSLVGLELFHIFTHVQDSNPKTS